MAYQAKSFQFGKGHKQAVFTDAEWDLVKREAQRTGSLIQKLLGISTSQRCTLAWEIRQESV